MWASHNKTLSLGWFWSWGNWVVAHINPCMQRDSRIEAILLYWYSNSILGLLPTFSLKFRYFMYPWNACLFEHSKHFQMCGKCTMWQMAQRNYAFLLIKFDSSTAHRLWAICDCSHPNSSLSKTKNIEWTINTQAFKPVSYTHLTLPTKRIV